MSSNNGWTPERKQRQREAIQKWRPWERSTGPRTDAGKERSAMNALVHGMNTAHERALTKRINAILREQRRRLLQV